MFYSISPRRFLFFALLLSLCACSTPEAARDFTPVTAPGETFSGVRALVHVENLCTPEMEGRQSGLPGAERAEAYAADCFDAWGLIPMGDDKTFLQSFPMLVTELRSASMTLQGTRFSPVDLVLHEDYYPLTHSGSGKKEGKIVFVGHGISKPEKGWDDYGQTDVRGKVVVIVRGQPPVGGQNWSTEYSRTYTAAEARERGAAAILYLQGKKPIHGAAILEAAYSKDLPMAYIGEHLAEQLLAHCGETLERYKASLKKAPRLLETGLTMEFDFDVKRYPGGRTANVVGCIPGSDPVLKDEYIVIGGHLDHLGVCPGGFPFHGANDNASGSAVVLELARAFAEAPEKPARSLIFALFAAEEQGLLGSEFMAANPPVDREKMALMVNYDMAGHGNGTVGLGGSEAFPSVWHALLDEVDSRFLDQLYLSRAWGGGSDQASFRAVGIPAFSIWSRGDHLFYHTVYDTPELVKTDVMHAVGTVSEKTIREFADWPHGLGSAYQEERLLLGSSCQVDFDAAWSGFETTGDELQGPFSKTDPFVHGALWNIEREPWEGDDRDSMEEASSREPGRESLDTSTLFDCFSRLDEIKPPAALGSDFRRIGSNVGRQQFTLLPCVTERIVEEAGEKGAAMLKELGAVCIIANSANLLQSENKTGLHVVVRLEDLADTAPKKALEKEGAPDDGDAYTSPNGKGIIVCDHASDRWLDRACDLKNENALFVIRVDDEVTDFEGLKRAIDSLQPASCHLDLTRYHAKAAKHKRVEKLFGFLRSLGDAGLDVDSLKGLLGRNLLSWADR